MVGNMNLQQVLIVFGMLSTISWVAWLVFSSIWRYSAAKNKTELQAGLLQRIDSAQSMLAYAESDAGRKFLKTLEFDRAEPYAGIIRCSQFCVVFLIVGAAFLGFHVRYASEIAALIIGIGGLVLGFAFGAAACVSYCLHRSFGLLRQDDRC
jgi:hypothetical protein